MHFAVAKDVDGSVAIKRTGNYSVDYELVELTKIAGKTRHMPDEFINEAGNFPTAAFVEYLAPLIGPLPEFARLAYASAKQ